MQLGAALLQKASHVGFPPREVQEAIEQLTAALRLDPTQAEAELQLALAWAALQQPAEAVSHAARAVELRRRNKAPLNGMLGPALAAEAHSSLAEHWLARRISHRGRALCRRHRFSSDSTCLNNMGVMMIKLGETDRADSLFRGSRAVHPITTRPGPIQRTQKARAAQPATP